MAQKFFENLNVNEIKAMLKTKHDPRFTDSHSVLQVSDDLQSCIQYNEADKFHQIMMSRYLPQIDYLVQDSMSVCTMTKHLWQTVVKHINLFYEIVNTHDMNNDSQIDTVKQLLQAFKVQEVSVLKDIQLF